MRKKEERRKVRGVESLKHLLVDASNIMHAWPELRALLAKDRDVARARLSSLLAVIHDVEAMRVTVVFDGRGEDVVVEYPLEVKTFAHIYTPSGTTADDVIERLVGHAADPALCTVATDDHSECRTIEATGAAGISAAALREWVERAERRQLSQLAARQRDNQRQWQKGKK